MPANLENIAVATALEKVSFHSNPKERQCQNLLRLLDNCRNLTHWQCNAWILQARLNCMWTMDFQMFKLDLEKAEEPEIKLPTSVGSSKKQESSRKPSVLLTMPNPLTLKITTHLKILKEMGIPDHLTCLLRNMHAGQETTVRTGHGTTDWFQIEKVVCQCCILLTCLFNLYAEWRKATGFNIAWS